MKPKNKKKDITGNSKTKFVRGSKRKLEKKKFTEALEKKRMLSATNLQNCLMELAMPAIGFKQRLLSNEMAPDFLRLKNADDILDRTLPKPTQNVNMSGQILQANMSTREIKELILQKLESNNE